MWLSLASYHVSIIRGSLYTKHLLHLHLIHPTLGPVSKAYNYEAYTAAEVRKKIIRETPATPRPAPVVRIVFRLMRTRSTI